MRPVARMAARPVLSAVVHAPYRPCRNCGCGQLPIDQALCPGCDLLERVTISRSRWRRAFWALIVVWATLVGVSLLAPHDACPQLRGRLQPAYSRSIPLGVRGAPWPAHA